MSGDAEADVLYDYIFTELDWYVGILDGLNTEGCLYVIFNPDDDRSIKLVLLRDKVRERKSEDGGHYYYLCDYSTSDRDRDGNSSAEFVEQSSKRLKGVVRSIISKKRKLKKATNEEETGE